MKIYLLKRTSKISEESQKKGKRRMISLYLAYHFGTNKKRKYEFLNLYLFDKPKSTIEKDHNKETQKLADAIKARKILEAQSNAHGFVSSAMGKISFIDFFKSMTDQKWESNGNHGNWLSALNHLKIYCKGKDVTLSEVDDRFLEGFKDYLLNKAASRGNKANKLSQNSALSYFNKVKAALKEAYNKKLIKEDPSLRVKGIREGETHREFLTLEELQTLAITDCEIKELKEAFLFSALTGLRWSDIKELKWENIFHIQNEGWFIRFTQKKTKGTEVLPMSEQALTVVSNRKDTGYLFDDLHYSAHNNIKLSNWIAKAGISKKITFHCARHSFATLQLSMNTDIYTVSKLLGHRHLKTTEIYAKVIDKKKFDAVNRIPQIVIKSE